MQLAGNSALAAALATGQKRQFMIKLMFDWDRNGTYSNVNSDMSALFVDATVDRQLSGSFPNELEITEGYVAAQLDVQLEGNLADGTPVWKAFSPYSGYALGGVATIGTPMYLELIVMTSAGPVNIRQFTGYLADPVPARAAGTVTITAYDAGTAVLSNPITLPTWAVDSYTRTQLTQPDTPDSGTTALGWVVENVLRRNGFLQGPPWHPNAIVAWTLNGSALPEVGSIGMEDRWVNGTWSFGYGEWNLPQYTPSGKVSDVYGPGKYGSTCFKGATKLPALSGRGVTYLYGNAHANPAPVTGANACVTPGAFGSNNSNILGSGCWFQVDPTQTATPSTMLIHLEEAHYNYSSASTTDRKPAYLQVSLNHQTGALSAVIWNEGWTTSWTYASTGTLAAGWHYINFVANFLPSSIAGYWIIDGTFNTSSTGGQSVGLGSVTYSNDAGNTNLCQVIARGPMQYAQFYYQLNTPLSGHVLPTMNPVTTTAAVDQCLTRLNWLPDVNQAAGWDTLKSAIGAELGALYITEAGVVTFDNRVTVAGRQLAANSVLTLTMDQVMDISPQSSLLSIVNSMPYTCHAQQAIPYSTVYATSASNQFSIPVGTTQQVPVTQAGVQSARMGYVSWHPQAQGYNNPANPTEPGGAGPSGLFTYRDWMNAFGPSFWYDGFTAYVAGSSDPNAQPAEGTGLDCRVQVGQALGDLDPRRILLFLINSTGSSALEFAVNDSTPFLHVGGTVLADLGNTTSTYADAASVATYGTRSLPYPATDWVQDPTSVLPVVQSVVAYTRNPHAYLQAMDIVGDPRLQLQDVVTVADPAGMGASIPASVYGIKRRISVKDGLSDTLTLRTF